MYKHAGASLKKFVSGFVVVEMAFCLFIGLSLFMIGCFTLGAPGDNTVSVIMCVSGILITVVGCFLIWSKYLILAAFAELVDETKKTSDNLAEIKEYVFGGTKPNQVHSISSTDFASSTFSAPVSNDIHNVHSNEINGTKIFYYTTDK